MNFRDLVLKNKFSLVVSLPDNRLDFARAALEGGAQGIKLHLNLLHRASGNSFGSLEKNKDFIRELLEIAGEVPVGVVPGAQDAFITEEELKALEHMGIGFFSSYLEHLPPFMMSTKKLVKMVAISSDYNDSTVRYIKRSPIDILEGSIISGQAYGTSLNYGDLLQYEDLVRESGKPLLVPSQKKIKPREARHLYEHGCKALMIGAIVTGGENAERIKSVTAEFREVIEGL